MNHASVSHCSDPAFARRLRPMVWSRNVVISLWRKLSAGAMAPSAVSHYRPERHYMRGPGPKWHERNSPRG